MLKKRFNFALDESDDMRLQELQEKIGLDTKAQTLRFVLRAYSLEGRKTQ